MRLVIENLACSRSERLLFRDLSFALAAGEAIVVKGPNGAGKSSLLRMVAGFLAPTAGTIRIEDAGEETRPASFCHYLGHRDGLRGALTAGENLDFAAALFGAGLSSHQALAQVGLPSTADRPVALLSAGQKRRVALAGLLVTRRPLWLLDEPTTALDSHAQATVARLIEAHLGAGGMALIATHLPLGIGARELTLGARP